MGRMLTFATLILGQSGSLHPGGPSKGELGSKTKMLEWLARSKYGLGSHSEDQLLPCSIQGRLTSLPGQLCKYFSAQASATGLKSCLGYATMWQVSKWEFQASTEVKGKPHQAFKNTVKGSSYI